MYISEEDFCYAVDSMSRADFDSQCAIGLLLRRLIGKNENDVSSLIWGYINDPEYLSSELDINSAYDLYYYIMNLE